MNIIKKIIIVFTLLFISIILTSNTSMASETISNKNSNTIKINEIVLKHQSFSLVKGKTLSLLKTINPSNASNKSIKWSSSNPKVATVSNAGVVKGISRGISTIRAQALDGSHKVKTCTVKITPIEPTIISLNSKDHTVPVGTSFQLQALIQPQNADNKSIKWTSSNSNIATITKTGKVQGKSLGHVTITATTHNGITTSCLIRVNIPAKSINLNKTSLTLPVGGKDTLSVNFNPINTSSKEVTWISSNPNVISLPNTKTSTTTLTAKKEGSSVITAISKYGLKTTCTVKVTKALKSPAGFTSKNYNGVKYYESIPKNATENLPLIIFIHGDGEVNKFSKLRTLPIVKYVESNEAYKAGKFIFIAP